MKLESGIVLRRSSFMVLFFDSLFVCLLVSPFLSGCRIAKSGKDLPSDQPTMQSDSTAAKPPLVQPQRQTGATSPAQALPIMLDSNGNEKGRTVLRLDYFAPPKPGGVTVPSCFDSILAHLVIGRLVCGSNPALGIDVTAGQLDQTCYTESNEPKVLRKQPVNLPSCSGPSTLQIYGFSPEMKVEVRNEP